jgi:hypothetical protein
LIANLGLSKLALKTPGPANYIMPNSLFSGPQYSLSYRYLPEGMHFDDLFKNKKITAGYALSLNHCDPFR